MPRDPKTGLGIKGLYKPEIPHELRPCKRFIHGNTPHACYTTSEGNVYWRCLACMALSWQRWKARKDAGEPTEHRTPASPSSPTTCCPACWLVHPVGGCDR